MLRADLDHEKLEKLEMKERLSASDKQLQELLDFKESVMSVLGLRRPRPWSARARRPSRNR